MCFELRKQGVVRLISNHTTANPQLHYFHNKDSRRRQRHRLAFDVIRFVLDIRINKTRPTMCATNKNSAPYLIKTAVGVSSFFFLACLLAVPHLCVLLFLSVSLQPNPPRLICLESSALQHFRRRLRSPQKGHVYGIFHSLSN